MIFRLDQFFRPSRLLDWRAGISPEALYFLLAIFGAMVVAAVIVKIAERVKKRENFQRQLLNKYFSFFLTMGSVGLFLVWVRYEHAVILSARLWLLIWFIGLIIWLIFILKYQFKVVPEAQKKLNERRMFEKYLPRRK